jgi:hypothetical protein
MLYITVSMHPRNQMKRHKYCCNPLLHTNKRGTFWEGNYETATRGPQFIKKLNILVLPALQYRSDCMCTVCHCFLDTRSPRYGDNFVLLQFEVSQLWTLLQHF